MRHVLFVVLLLTVPTAAAEIDLSFTAAQGEFRFDTGALRGVLHGKGTSHGLNPVVDAKTGKPLAHRWGLFSHCRMFDATAQYAPEAWTWSSKAERLSDGAVEFRWSADAGHPLDMKAVYRWRGPATLDVITTVTARRDLPNFEIFLASYLADCEDAFVYVKQDASQGKKGTLLQTKLADGMFQMFPRDAEAAKIVFDGRWRREPIPLAWVNRAEMAAPLVVRRNATTGLPNLGR